MNRINAITQGACARLSARLCCLREEGQGTTEYAILVGVLAVIAMVAIIAFKDKVSELWNAIKDGINGL
jgi:Flp pilus assembly pilin Flp